MKIVVSTCKKYQHLLNGFAERFMQHWGDDFYVDIAGKDEAWSDQMIRICQMFKEDYFIRLCEDFWLTEQVDYENLFHAWQLATIRKYDRVGLQSVKDGYEHCSKKDPDTGWYKLDSDAEYLCSFEASIYKRTFLLKNLEPGRHIWETEVEMSRRTRGANVLIPPERIVKYTDATRRGQERAKIENGVMYVLQPGDVWKQV